MTMKKKRFVKPVGIVLDEQTYDILVKITTREELSKSEFIRNAVKEVMDRYQGKEERKNAK
jgi:metal-responsive CopG/Arc/MetJ family transcriptional regulator